MIEDMTIESSRRTELETVLLAGQILVEGGAEIDRTEDTMKRLANALKLKEIDAFVTNRGIFATAEKANGEIETRVVNIPPSDVDIDRIEAVNELSRLACSSEMSTMDVWDRLIAIRKQRVYSRLGRILSYALGAVGFSYAIGTSFQDALCAGAIGAVIGIYMIYADRFLKSRVLVTIIASTIIAVLGNLFTALGLGTQLSAIILGAMIDIVPGVSFVNSVREFSQNNFTTGMTLLMSALLTCISMAAGVAFVQIIVPTSSPMTVFSADITRIDLGLIAARSLFAGVGTIAFGIMFRVRKQHFLDCGILGTITWFIYLTALHFKGSMVVAVFISCFCVAFASKFLAIARRCPITVFLMTSLFPLLPGISFYRSVYYMMMGNESLSLDLSIECFIIAFTIAVSIIIVQQIPVHIRSRVGCKNNCS